MAMQIAEASPAVRVSLRLLLFSRQFFCCPEKKVLYVNLDAQNLSMLGKGMPDFKG